MKLGAWYVDDSATKKAFDQQIDEMKKYSDWKIGPSGGENGALVKCDYTSASLPNQDILIQIAYNKSICDK